MITVACWKWRRIATGHQLPHVVDYTAEHVHRLRDMVQRNTTVEHQFVCITDDPEGLDCETLPLWNTLEAGGCYHRLKAFDPEFDLLGDRFAWIDLDCVITGNIDHLLEVDADFAIHRYAYNNRPLQRYNGGLLVMNRGARRQVWETFDPVDTPKLIARLNHNQRVVGSDQAWISLVLGQNERKLGPADGVYEVAHLRDKPLPGNACAVMFSGARDPSASNLPWVKEHYR